MAMKVYGKQPDITIASGFYKGDDGGYYIPHIDSDGFLTWTPSEAGMEEVPSSYIPKGDKGEPFRFEDFTPEQLASLKGEKGEDGVVTFEALTQEQKDSLKGAKGDKGDKGDKGEKGDRGLQGIQGEKGEKGEDGSVVFEELTPEQKEMLRGYKGEQGEKGDKGDPFTYKDFTPEQLAALKGDKGDTGAQGERGLQGEQGIQGVKGDKGADGAKGDDGDSGVYVGTSAPTDADKLIWINPDGDGSELGELATKDYVDEAVANFTGGITEERVLELIQANQVSYPVAEEVTW